jgi:hypothetical protein
VFKSSALGIYGVNGFFVSIKFLHRRRRYSESCNFCVANSSPDFAAELIVLPEIVDQFKHSFEFLLMQRETYFQGLKVHDILFVLLAFGTA